MAETAVMDETPVTTSKIAALWDESTRPQFVKDTLMSLGAEKLLAKVGLDEKVISGVAAMTTVAGLKEKKAEIAEIAAPLIEKAQTPEGRAQLKEDVLATELAQTVKAKVTAKVAAGKEFAAPYIASVKETSAPYVAKIEAIRRSERVEAMVAAFQEAREHPAEKVGELRAAAVDLIKYENLRAYREHIMSAEFQADTARLVQVDLPAIASSAAKRGAETIKAKATTLSAEIETFGNKVKIFVKGSYEQGLDKVSGALEKVPSQAELEVMRLALKEKGTALMVELQAEVSSGVEHVKTEGFSMPDILERLKRVVGVFDKVVLQPLLAAVKTDAKEEEEGDETPVASLEVKAVDGETVQANLVIKEDERPLPVNGSAAESEGEESLKDAME